jgi:hypothetical protein
MKSNRGRRVCRAFTYERTHGMHGMFAAPFLWMQMAQKAG